MSQATLGEAMDRVRLCHEESCPYCNRAIAEREMATWGWWLAPQRWAAAIWKIFMWCGMVVFVLALMLWAIYLLVRFVHWAWYQSGFRGTIPLYRYGDTPIIR
jgi:hypothetical protein